MGAAGITAVLNKRIGIRAKQEERQKEKSPNTWVKALTSSVPSQQPPSNLPASDDWLCGGGQVLPIVPDEQEPLWALYKAPLLRGLGSVGWKESNEMWECPIYGRVGCFADGVSVNDPALSSHILARDNL